MANTERLAALAKVRTAKNAIDDCRADTAIPPEDRAQLERAYNALDAVEDDLILQEIGDHVDELKAASVALGQVTANMNTAIAQIQKVVVLVADAAQALKALANIAAAATAAGLL